MSRTNNPKKYSIFSAVTADEFSSNDYYTSHPPPMPPNSSMHRTTRDTMDTISSMNMKRTLQNSLNRRKKELDPGRENRYNEPKDSKQPYGTEFIHTNNSTNLRNCVVPVPVLTSTKNSAGKGKRPRRRKLPPPPPPRESSNPKSVFNLPPLKIIKASVGFKGTFFLQKLRQTLTGLDVGLKPGELSFVKGDFFYVIKDHPDNQVYEVMNPIEKTRGLVHYCHFNNVARNITEERQHQDQLSRELAADAFRSTDGFMTLDGPKSAPTQDGWNSSRNPEHSRNRWSDNDTDYDPKQQPQFDPLEDYYGQDMEDRAELDQVYDDLIYGQSDDMQRFDDINHDQSRKSPDFGTSAFNSIPEKKNRKKKESDLQSCLVQSCYLSKEKWYFVIHVKYVSGKLDIIRRSCDDIWALQVNFLSRFPQFSGLAKLPRSIPFLTLPLTGASREEAKEKMNRYLREFETLPYQISESPYFIKFFQVKIGDLADTSISSDMSNTLLYATNDVSVPPPQDITVKLTVGPSECIEWRDDAEGFTFEELMYQVRDRFGGRLGGGGRSGRKEIQKLLYCDETNAMVPLHGNEDLRLLISLSPTLELFISNK